MFYVYIDKETNLGQSSIVRKFSGNISKIIPYIDQIIFEHQSLAIIKIIRNTCYL